MNNKYLVGLIVLVLAACVFSISFVQYLSKGCFWWDCAPERNFHISDWEIPLYLLPEGSSADHLTIPNDNNFGEIEGGFQDFYLGDRIAYYDIYRFPREKNATSRFEHDRNDMFDRDTGKIWETPNNIVFSSEKADDTYVACGYWSNIYRCKMTARYQEYVLFFSADINDQMTFEYFEKILYYLDEQISNRLYP